MQKNARLADIYIKIYNKQPLIMEDLAFLAKYDRECFEKTCRNLIYNIPEAKELMKPMDEPSGNGRKKPTEAGTGSQAQKEVLQQSAPEKAAPNEDVFGSVGREGQASQINTLLDNLKKMEWQEMPIPNLDAGKVKNLLGSLYMEMLFPHNDRYRHFNLEEDAHGSVFNRKV